MRFLLASFFVLALPCWGMERITIRERVSEKDTQYSHFQLIEPEHSWEESATYWYRVNSSLRLIPSTQASSTGFGIPSIRGRHPKYTEIYLQDWLLQDPLTSYPMVDELDLRFFGRLELQLGNGSIDNTSLNPYATIRYQVKPSIENQQRLSVELGDVYGESLWGLSELVGDNSFTKIYLRRHRASGHYPVYSNGGTPLNSSDDRIVSQTNNDQSSLQGMIFSQWNQQDHVLSLLARNYKKSNGFAPFNPDLDAAARGATESSLILTSYRFYGLAGHSLYLTAGWRRDLQLTKDPQREILGSFTDFERENQSREFALEWEPNLLESMRIKVRQEHKAVDIYGKGDSNFAYNSQRSVRRSYLGLNYKVLPKLLLSAKGEWLDYSSEHESMKQRKHLDSYGLALDGILWQPLRLSFNLQLSKTQTPPNLLAEFGNGAGITSNLDILPEKALHGEFGLKGKYETIDFRIAYFEDDTEDKIVFIPVSLGTEKAINVDESVVKGWEASVGWSGAWWRYQMSVTQLEAFFENSFGRFQLPKTPAKVMTSEITLYHDEYRAYMLNRFEGQIYRDLANDQKIPAHWLTDIGASMDCSFSENELDLSLAIINAFDLKHLEYQTATDQGAIAFSQGNGYPLPGRQIKFQLDLIF
ncbi:MAG: TonB-dependent receptor [Pseudobacteriovorax sp.]|nr:TonB-dependent receptor [Pseudobacteriovorax sp.]